MKYIKKTEQKSKVITEKGFEVSHKNLIPQLPSQIVNVPKEATDPAEMIKHA